MKNIFLLIALAFVLNATTITKEQCEQKDAEEYIFSGGECIQFFVAEGEAEGKINILVHGVWSEGTNTLGRYGPFADNLAMATDVTTIAIALPGYANSSENNLKLLGNKKVKSRAATKEYVEFMTTLLKDLKAKFEARTLTYVGHSAGGMIGSTVTARTPGIIDNLVSVGARYDIHAVNKAKGLLSMVDFLDNISKDTNIVLVYGTADKISKPEVTTSFYEVLKNKGLKVKLVKVQDAPHLDLDMTDPTIEAITELVEE